MNAVTIGGEVVSWEHGVAFDWKVEAGVEATIQAWMLPADTCARLIDAFRGQEVEIVANGKTIKRVYVLGTAAANHPQMQLLLLTDVRWYWTRGWLVKAANVRPRIGETSLVGEGDLQALAVVDTIKYAPWSLDQGANAYTWEAISRETLVEATSSANGRPDISWTIDGEPGFAIQTSSIQELWEDGSMPAGISRAVSALPGRGIYVDLDGVVHVYDRSLGSESITIEGLPPAKKGWGSLRRCDYAASRPKSYRVLFDLELEVLFFSIRSDLPFTTDNANLPWMMNVLEVPDKKLVIPALNGRPARTAGVGSIEPHADVYQAWGSPGIRGTGQDPGPLTDDRVRSLFNNSDLLKRNYATTMSGDVDPIWAARIDAVIDSYRTLWQANPLFWNRVLSAQARRAALWNPSTGLRAPSPVYNDYARQPTIRALAAGLTQIGDNVTSWSPLLASCAKAAPASLKLVDEDLGIFKTSWASDVRGLAGPVAPSAIDGIPDINATLDPYAKGLLWSFCALVDSAHYNCATIVSCTPAAPNDRRRLYEVEVTLEEAIDTLKARGFDDRNRVALGPDQDLRIRSGVTTALMPYLGTTTNAVGSDDRALQTLSYFGATPGPVVVLDENLQIQTLDPINLELELRPLAKGAAAGHLALHIDHYQGKRKTPLDWSIVPIGSIAAVTHRIGPDEAITEIEARAPRVAMVDPFAFLPQSARKTIQRLAQP